VSTLSRRPDNLSSEEKRVVLAELLRKKARKRKSFPLSFAQQRLWFLDQMSPGAPVYNVPLAARFTGPLDVSVFERALQAVVCRHDTLRTTFVTKESDVPVQVVAPELSLSLIQIDLCAASSGEPESEIRRLAIEESQRPFDLTHGPLIRATLLHLSEQDHVLLLTLHHIISDGWSLGVLLHDLLAFYKAFTTDSTPALPELSIQYGDYAAWQRRWLEGEVLEGQLDYWKDRLAGAPPTLDLPTDRPRPPTQRFHGALLPFEISPDLAEAARALAQREGCTLYMVLLAAFQTLLRRYSGQDDFCVGSPIAGRGRPETEGLIGFFVNTLVLRADLSGDPTFAQLLGRVREDCLGAYAHQDLPFERLVEELQPQRDLAHSPLFQTLFVFHNSLVPTFEFADLKVRQWDVDTGTSKFDLSLFLVEQEGGLRATLEYSTELYEAATARRLVEHYETLLEAACAEPDRPVSRLPLLTAAELAQLSSWNDTRVNYPQQHLLHQLIQEQVQRSPDAEAVRFEDRCLSYQQLDRRAALLASRLTDLGVGPDVPVGVCMERSVELVIALLGVLKAGGTYVPLDPDYPSERLDFMLKDAAPTVLLTQSHLASRLPNYAGHTLCLDLGWGTDADTVAAPILPERVLTPEHLAYIIYTSGSTGRPKGAMNTHRGICNRLLWMQQQYHLGPDDTVLQKTPYSFDVSVWEFFWPLLTGARLVLARPGGHKDPTYLTNLIHDERVTVCHFVPSMLRAFLSEPELEERCVCLREVICSGEALPYELQQRFFGRLSSRLHNLYGPTEAAVDVTYWPCRRDDARRLVPIGRPVANTQMHVLDKQGHAVPVGVSGELYIGGVQLARGYLNREELTAERFIHHVELGRLYRTGDVGRWLSDGVLEYLGRTDHQVKLRGFRIELGEVEAALAEHSAVRESVAVVREDAPGDQRLAAYVVPDYQAGHAEHNGAAERRSEQVSQWRTVWEETYSKETSNADPTFNTIGWNSSYTGLPIPDAEMREWLEHTITRIDTLRPSRVAEIGCGSGMLLFRIAPRCKTYTGIDFSETALHFLRRQLAVSERRLPQVSLLQRAAHELDGLPSETFDTVILNSVIQYFPGIDYLLRVVAGAARLVRPGGRIFVGDVRNFRLLAAFHSAVQLHKAPATLSREQLRARVQGHTHQEGELLVDPAFFTALRHHIPRIGRVEIQLKRGCHRNELTRFRYDVVLHIGTKDDSHDACEIIDWQEQTLKLPAIRTLLQKNAPRSMSLLHVPNARLQAEAKSLELLFASVGPQTANDLRDALRDVGPSGVDPEAFWTLGQELGYQVEVRWSGSGRNDCFDVEFRHPMSPPGSRTVNGVEQPLASAGLPTPWADYANDPVRGKVIRSLVPALRTFLRGKLPEYMVPSAFVTLDELPLSPNGKVDRNALPVPECARPELEEAYVAPATAVEQALAELWAEVLGLERVGTQDNFFELGGHSLLATQVISRVRKTLQVELPLRALFEAPTVATLAERVEEVRRAALGLPAAPLRPIVRNEESPLSYGQETFWFLEQMEAGSPVFNIDVSARLRGPLNLTAVEQALDEVVRRHESLRTTFVAREGRPVAVIAPPAHFPVQVLDLTGLPESEREGEARRLADEDSRRTFDMEHGPLFRVSLLRLGPEDHAGLLTVHHAVFDGWSMGIILREIGLLYQAFCAGKPSPLPELSIQYADFAHWQRQWLKSGLMEDQLAYWKKQLAGPLPVLELPTDHPRPAVRTFHGARQLAVVPPDLTAAIHSLARREGCTLYMVLLAAFEALLQRYSGQDDLCIGTPIAGRNRAEIEGLLGFFVNTLVLRTDLSGDPTFTELLARVREVCLGAYAHQDLPFEMLVKELRPQRELSRSSLFQVMFILQNAPLKIPMVAGLSSTPFVELSDNGTSKFDLTLTLMEGVQGLTAAIEYNTDLFEADTMQRLVGHYRTLLEAVVAEPRLNLSRLPLLTATEQEQLAVWNRTDENYPVDECIHELFEAQAVRTPDAVAVVCGDRSLSYRQLDRRANGLAKRLRDLGVGPEVLVGLYLERSLDLLVGVLGVLKAGGAYVPLDPAYPGQRLAAIVEDAQPRVLLTQRALVDDLPANAAHILCLDTEALESGDDTTLGRSVACDNLAYVIYTSGTTGKPKGAMLTHGGLCNAYRAWEDAYQLRSEVTAHLQMASCAFDVFTGDWTRALCSGGKLVLCPREFLLDATRLYDLMRREGVDCAEFVPSVLRNLAQHLEESGQSLDFMRVLIAGSDVWYAEEYRRIRRLCGPQTRLINSYGLTEATIDSTYFESADMELSEERPVPIGRPFANSRIHLLDRNLQPVPVGVPGELHIAGPGLARGYFKDAELTAKKFIPDPFSRHAGERLFRTGDLACYLPDGTIELLGRTDHQVKVRGFRIEPGEIESVLGQHPGVRQAAVVARGDIPDNKRLVAYLTAPAPSPQELRTFLKEKLPEYMVPSAFVALDALPLSPNGKIDRQALAAIEEAKPESQADFIAPRTPVEEDVAAIWASVLGLERVGVNDNFFDVGGHSLLATQVISRLAKAFQVELPLRRLFEVPTVAGLAEAVEVARRAGEVLHRPPIQRLPREGPLPLSFAQQRLWFLDRFEPGSPFYNIPAAARLSGDLDIIALERSLQEVVRRHETLRTTFQTVEGQPAQVIAPTLTLPLPLVDLTSRPEVERAEEARRLAREEAQRPFDLTRAPLLRATLLKLGPQEHVVLLVMHHIVSDGWSMGVFFREVATLYQAFLNDEPSSIPELPVQYADFACWQRDWLQGELLESQLTYWQDRLANVPAALELPTDHPRPAVQTVHGAMEPLLLPSELVERLHALSRREGCTLYMILLAAFQALLHRYSGQEDFCIGTPVAGRTRPEMEGLIGFFVNTLVLRADLSGDPTFAEHLKRVRETCLGAYAHQDLPFEMLVEALQPQRDLSRSPLFQVMLILQNTPLPSLDLPGLQLNPIEAESGTAKFDLNLALVETDRGLVGSLEYNTDLFEAATVRRLLVHFRNLLEEAAANPERRVSELPLLTAEERHQLLTEWNCTEADLPDRDCIHRLFEAQVERTPEAIALIYEDEKVTYCELNRRANQLAHHLRDLGVGPEVLVGICMERSIEMVVGLLGILKASGAYVPLDPGFPRERIAFMLKDARVPLVLTQKSLQAGLPDQEVRLVLLDADAEAIARHSADDPASGVESDNLAYVLYTSGSTGLPKGVQITHGSVVNFLASMSREPGLSDQDTLLAVTTLSFDIAGLEIFLPLTVGARLVLVPREVTQDGKRLAEKLSDATVMQATPVTWQMLLDAGWPGSPGFKILCGGEAMPSDLARQLLGRCASLWNMYGPTETTIWSTVHRVDGRVSPVPIGRPIANTQVYVTDSRGQPVPVGVAGELLIGGAGLARGYLGRPELTHEKFIPNPYSDSPGSRLYRTGDLARWLPNGELECLGRLDHQVKVRGFRIELGEIESVLGLHPDVSQVAVVARGETPENKRLIAYFVPDHDDLAPERTAEHVALWQGVWDEAYGRPSRLQDPTLNFNGWNSSYTGLPIPETEMREWVDCTAERILDLRPGRVLEIGCGTGLLLSRLAPHCSHYVGTDISEQAIRYLHEQIPRFGCNSVAIHQRAADDFTGFTGGAFDAVILNSVVQYFPDVDYLMRVLTEAIKVVSPGGHVFVGDVRNLALLEVFHASIELQQADDSTPVEQLVHRVRKKMAQERELVIDPALFPVLKEHLPRLRNVEIQLKRGSHNNEMTAYRYDVVLHVGDEELPTLRPNWIDYQESGLTPEKVRRQLKEERPDVFAITGVPNARIPAPAIALQQMADQPRGTVGDMRILPADTGVDPEDLCRLIDGQPYTIDMRWTMGAEDGRFDVVFRHRDVAGAVPPKEEVRKRPWSAFTNNPLKGNATQRLVHELRGYLRERLPEYMVPSAFVMLDALPQTPNGKLDRKALPMTEQGQPEGLAAFVAPRTPTEDMLAQTWAEVLGVERVGIHDNFFDLGGHSLQAVQLVTRVSNALRRDISVKSLFLYPTVVALAEAVESTHTALADSTAIPPIIATASAVPMDLTRLVSHSPWLTVERRPLLPLFESGELEPVQSVAIGYLPSALLQYTGLSPTEVIEGWCHNRPVMSGLYETPLGRIGLMLLPRFDSEIYHDSQGLIDVLGQAVQTAGRIGARVVSLTGLLASATRYGEALAGQERPRITTGHATTTAAVVQSVRGLLAIAGRDLTQERVGFVGLGSVGTATLRTLLRCLPHPAEIRLCDIYSKRDALHELRREIVEELDYHGPVHILETNGTVPAKLYESSLLIGATNVPNILDVGRFEPGTLLVDDSSPHCFRVDRAVGRLREQQDFLFTEGGMLQAPRPLKQMLYVPAELEQVMPALPAEMIDNHNPQHITGCVLSSLLSAQRADLPPTIGLVEPRVCLDHYQALEQLGFRAALHCEGCTLDEDGVRDFRRRFGRDGNIEVTPR
jgi:amino acid adenylation domain-containing protein